MTIAAKLRRLKAERGVSAAEMSDATGVAIQTLLDILDGKTRRPHERTVRRLALYFHVSPAYFLLEDEEGAGAGAGLEDEITRLDERLSRLEESLGGDAAREPLSPARRLALEEKYLSGERLELRLPGQLTPRDRERLLEILDTLERFVSEGNYLDRRR
jgi:transcriptional regulator with XRE-family HTH domain